MSEKVKMKVMKDNSEYGFGGYNDDVLVEFDKYIISIGNMADCPEDANLSRDLRFVLKIPEMLKKANQMGLEGKELEIEKKVVDK